MKLHIQPHGLPREICNSVIKSDSIEGKMMRCPLYESNANISLFLWLLTITSVIKIEFTQGRYSEMFSISYYGSVSHLNSNVLVINWPLVIKNEYKEFRMIRCSLYTGNTDISLWMHDY